MNKILVRIQKNYLIYGISKGLGKALVKNLLKQTDMVFGVSRSEPDYLFNYSNVNWIKADLSLPLESNNLIKEAIKDETIDYLIYNVGIWEKKVLPINIPFQKVVNPKSIT